MKSLIERLNDDDESERCFAAQDLGQNNKPDYVLHFHISPLIERLKIEKSRIVKEAIIVALGRLPAKRIIEGVIGLFQSGDPFVRNSAVAVLKKMGVEAIPSLLQQLEHADPDIRKFSLDTLTVLEEDLSTAIYGKALEDSDVNIRITAVEYVGMHRKFQFKSAVERNLIDSKNTMLTSACLQALLVIGDHTSYKVVLDQYPHSELISPVLRDHWWTIWWRRSRAAGIPTV